MSDAIIHFQTDDDADAHRVRQVLEALNFTVIRKINQPFGPAFLTLVADELAHSHKLTPRERTILRHSLDGHDNAAIAKRMKIAKSTVKWHLHNVLKKTDTRDRHQLLRLALQMGTKSWAS